MASLRHGVGHSLHGAQRGGGLCHGLGVELVPRWNSVELAAWGFNQK